MPIEDNMIPQFPSPDQDPSTFKIFPQNPVYIKGFVPEAQVMQSKEKPKKIGIIGTDDKVYYFLLKCDVLGDLRKEA